MNRFESTHPPGPSGVQRTGRWRLLGWSAAVLLLLVPLVAMQITDEVNWTASDFLVFALMLAAVGGGVELAARMTSNRAYRAGAALALLAAFLVLWANGAVGIIGNGNDPANLLFLGVLAVATIGALLSRGRPRGMMQAMAVTAVAQLLVGVVVPVLGLGHVWLVTAVFTSLWLSAAALFQRSRR